MKRSTTVAALALAGVLGLTGAGAAVAGAFGAADTTGAVSEVADGLVQRIEDALAGLVEDGTLTEEQANEVAQTLADSDLRGPHRPGIHAGPPDLAVLTDVLGMSEEDLQIALAEDGATLAAVAEDQGVAVDDVVAALQTAAEQRIEQAVTDGRITQERADEIIADLPERIAEAVQREWRGGHRWHDAGDDDGGPKRGHGPRGYGMGSQDG